MEHAPQAMWARRLLRAHHHLHTGTGRGAWGRDLGWQRHRAEGPRSGQEEEGLLRPQAWSRGCTVPPPCKGGFLPTRSTPTSAPLLGDHPWLCSTGGEVPITASTAMRRILCDKSHLLGFFALGSVHGTEPQLWWLSLNSEAN